MHRYGEAISDFWTKDMCGQVVRADIIKEKRCGQKEGTH